MIDKMGSILSVSAAVLMMAFSGLAAPSALAQDAAALKELTQQANKEGVLRLSWSQSTLAGSQGAQQFETALNKRFGTNIRIEFVPGAAMAQIGNQLATEFAAKQAAHVDVWLGAAAQVAPIVRLDFFEQVDWSRYIDKTLADRAVELDGKIVRIVTGLSGVTYNSAQAPMKPTTMADFLRPEWKGRIASTPYAASFDVLLADDVWGKDKTFDYVRKLSDQISGLMRCGESERIATGEFLALVMDCTGQDALVWQEKGAPIEQMVPRDAAQLRYYYFAVPKHARSPAAAKLFTAFFLTPEGQKIAWDTWKTDLHFMPGSNMAKQVSALEKEGVTFKEVTVEWWLKHPEIDAQKRDLIKILTAR